MPVLYIGECETDQSGYHIAAGRGPDGTLPGLQERVPPRVGPAARGEEVRKWKRKPGRCVPSADITSSRGTVNGSVMSVRSGMGPPGTSWSISLMNEITLLAAVITVGFLGLLILIWFVSNGYPSPIEGLLFIFRNEKKVEEMRKDREKTPPEFRESVPWWKE